MSIIRYDLFYGQGGSSNRHMKVFSTNDNIAIENTPSYTPVLDATEKAQDVAFTIATRWSNYMDSNVSFKRYKATEVDSVNGQPTGLTRTLSVPVIAGSNTPSASANRGNVISLHGKNAAGGNWRQDCYGCSFTWDVVGDGQGIVNGGTTTVLYALIQYYSGDMQLSTITARNSVGGDLVRVVDIDMFLYSNVNQYAHRHYSY